MVSLRVLVVIWANEFEGGVDATDFLSHRIRDKHAGEDHNEYAQ